MTMDERIEVVAPLFYPLIRVVPEAMPSTWENATDDAKDICRHLARKFLAAAFPELSGDKPGWIAPWEATEAMMARADGYTDFMLDPVCGTVADEWRLAWGLLRDAYLGKGDGG